jgi:hypothetical protein
VARGVEVKLYLRDLVLVANLIHTGECAGFSVLGTEKLARGARCEGSHNQLEARGARGAITRRGARASSRANDLVLLVDYTVWSEPPKP